MQLADTKVLITTRQNLRTNCVMYDNENLPKKLPATKRVFQILTTSPKIMVESE